MLISGVRCVQLESAQGSRGHSITIFHKRIYDSTETASMPLTNDYLDRCVQENVYDGDYLARFHSVLLLTPSDRLLRGIANRLRLETA